MSRRGCSFEALLLLLLTSNGFKGSSVNVLLALPRTLRIGHVLYESLSGVVKIEMYVILIRQSQRDEEKENRVVDTHCCVTWIR